MQIRKAKPEEAKSLEDFISLPDNASETYRHLVSHYISAMASDDPRAPVFLIALEDEQIVGCAAYAKESFAPGIWGISWINVRSDKRRNGLGGQLIESCIAEISKCNDGPFTAVLATLPEKSALYERHGFEKTSITHEGGWIMTRICPGAVR